jgi:programmed cell death 6-interacting protein
MCFSWLHQCIQDFCLLQLSSGIFNHLKDVVLSSVQADPTPDLHPDTLNALGALMLAQAQDCFVRKAMNGNQGQHFIF